MNQKLQKKKFNLRQQKRVAKRKVHQRKIRALMKSMGGRNTLEWFIRCIKLEMELKKKMKKGKKLLQKHQVTNTLLEVLDDKTNTTGKTT